MMVRILLLTILYGSASMLHGQTLAAADSSVDAIRVLYEKGAYLDAEVEARRLLEQPALPDSLRIAAEQYIAFALVAQGKPRSAVVHFSTILDADSTFDLDPLYISPKIIAALNEAKQLRRMRAPQSTADTLYTEKGASRTEPNVSWRVLVFPGWEQLHQDRETKGYLLLGAGSLAAALSIGFEIERASARRDYLAARTMQEASSRYGAYDRAHKARGWSIIAFAAVFLYSELDAFINLPHSDHVTLIPGTGSMHLAVRF